MADVFGAKTWVEINSRAFTNNIRSLKSILTDKSEFCAVVKANAYGHDLDTIVRLALLENVRCFGVDAFIEAKKVRARAPNADIFILGWMVPENAGEVAANGFIQTIYDEASLETLSKAAIELRTKARVNIKIETGTNRQGISLKKLEGFLREIRRRERSIELAGVSSHFADAETVSDPSFTQKQAQTFTDALKIVNKLGFDPPFCHVACSAAAIAFTDTQHTLSRFGIALYGIWSSRELRRSTRLSNDPIELKPVLSWKTRIAQVKEVASGEFVGYGRKFRADRPMRVAVLPVGYYDGYQRLFSQKTHVLVRGQRCPVVGIVCMNMIMVDVSQIPHAKTGDVVTLLGRDGMHEVSADDLAETAKTISYEIITQINPLLPRIVV